MINEGETFDDLTGEEIRKAEGKPCRVERTSRDSVQATEWVFLALCYDERGDTQAVVRTVGSTIARLVHLSRVSR